MKSDALSREEGQAVERSAPSTMRLRIVVTGTVQGVGFRPYVSWLARQLHLTGWISNKPQGVLIEVEGPYRSIQSFSQRLVKDVPRAATITGMKTQTIPVQGDASFHIVSSETDGLKRLTVGPDLGTCPDCMYEVQDPRDRRYRYPFTTCSHCGPRYSILTDLPYDRPRTTMAKFLLCVRCRDEYDDPEDRRHHAEALACPDCGPQLALWDEHGVPVAARSQAVRQACDVVRTGRILAVKGLGGFQLWVDARSESAVARLRTRKHRPQKPLAVLFPCLESIRAYCRVTERAETLLTSPEAQIVIIPRSSEGNLARAVSLDNPAIGAMLPYTPLHKLLTDEMGFPIVATSGNRAEEPIAIAEHEAIRRLEGIADAFLVHDRPIARPIDDSVVKTRAEETVLIRRARGYVPRPIYVTEGARCGRPLPPVLGLGGHLKNTVAFAVEDHVVMSQHIGDLSTPEAVHAFRRAVEELQILLERKPELIACDYHPDYRSSMFAEELSESHGFPVLRVQHHHAHIAACMAEHGLSGEVLGVAWDGSGYGLDGTVWGGEFLIASYEKFARYAHLLPFRLPGGEQAVHDPRRVAFSLLWATRGSRALERDRPLLRRLGLDVAHVEQLLTAGVAAPLASSMGRLFDGVAAMIGLSGVTSFEGQAAMAVEYAADRVAQHACDGYDPRNDRYDIPLTCNSTGGSSTQADWRPLIDALLLDVAGGLEPEVIAYEFHKALAGHIVRVASRAGIPHVVLTGGCFQNLLLTRLARERLEAAGFAVYTHNEVPPNDGGLALGQVMVAAATQKT